MITSFNGPLRTIQEFGLEVARGRVPGATPIYSFGELTTAGSVADRIIWPNGPYVFPGAAGATIELVSTSADDALGGTGVEKVEVHFLKPDFSVAAQIVDMNGLTPVTVDVDGAPLVDVRFIQCLHVHQTGTPGQGAVGGITAREAGGAGDDYAFIPVGKKRCASSARMVQKDKRLIVSGLVGSSISGTATAQAKIQVVATELDAYQYTDSELFFPFGAVGLQDASEAYTLPIPGVFKTGTIVALDATVDKGATINGGWYGWLEDTT